MPVKISSCMDREGEGRGGEGPGGGIQVMYHYMHHQTRLPMSLVPSTLCLILHLCTPCPAHLVLDVGLLCLVQVHFDESAAVETDTDPLPNDLRRVHQVLQHGVVDRGESPTAGAELLLLGPLVPLGLW